MHKVVILTTFLSLCYSRNSGRLSNPNFFFVFSLRTIVLAIAFSFIIFLICGKVYSCNAEENYIVMAKRKRFSTDEILSSLRGIRDDVS